MTAPALGPDLPCPEWCKLPAGHGFDWEFAGTMSRGHVAVTGDFVFTIPGAGPVCASVSVMSLESAEEPDGPARVSRPSIYIVGEVGDLSGSQARRVAAALLDADDQLDAVAT